jgi:hypothetical protein
MTLENRRRVVTATWVAGVIAAVGLALAAAGVGIEAFWFAIGVGVPISLWLEGRTGPIASRSADAADGSDSSPMTEASAEDVTTVKDTGTREDTLRPKRKSIPRKARTEGDPSGSEPFPPEADVGTFQCTSCGNEIEIAPTTHLPPCPACGNGEWIPLHDEGQDPYPTDSHRRSRRYRV